MSEAPKRRWTAFSLRTLFALVTVACVWIGTNVNRVIERQTVLQRSADSGGWWLDYDGVEHGPEELGRSGVHFVVAEREGEFDDISFECKVPLISQWRLWLGDQPVRQLALPPKTPERDIERAKKLFPEALGIYIVMALEESNHPALRN